MPNNLDYSTLSDKARGAFVGLAIGDALGMPYEFDYTSDTIRNEMQKVRHFHSSKRNIFGIDEPKGNWTDDTSMALCLADSLIEKQGYSSADIMDKYAKWLFEGYRTVFPIGFGVGTQTADAILVYEHKQKPAKTESAGNGCIMRLAPVILANINNSADEAIRMARLSCRETHDSTAAIAVTELMAATLYLLLHGATKEDLLDKSKALLKNQESLDFLETVKDSHDSIFNKSGKPLRDLGGYALDCFNIAMWGLINYDSFLYGMLGVLGLGGDADTNAAVYGQLAGAYYGYDLIPEEWKTQVYLGDEIAKLADKLIMLKSCKILDVRFDDEKA